MPANVAPVVIWACVGAFILCLIGALLVLFERWTPKSEATKKWLLSGVLASAVGGVGSFAAAQFSPHPAAALADTGQAAPSNNAPSAPSPAQPKARDEGPARPPTPSPAGPAASAEGAIPADLRAWAERALGARPVLAAVVDGHYPACAEQLRARPAAEIALSDARECRQELNRFNDTRIVAYYDLKRPYDRNLEEQGEELGRNGLTGEEVPRFNYVRSEMERLTGEEWDRLMEIQRRTQDDITRCNRTKCSAAPTVG